MTKVDIHLILTSGQTVTDIGQLSTSAKEWLRNAVKRGDVEKFVSYKFPIPKNAYRWVAA